MNLNQPKRIMIAFIFIISSIYSYVYIIEPPPNMNSTPGPTSTPGTTPTPAPTPPPQPTGENPPEPLMDAPSSPNSSPSPKLVEPGDIMRPATLIIPVAGIKPEQLQDTDNDSRSEGRIHNAIDIMAPHGTPVLAANNGKIVKLFNSEKGGITLYQLDPDEKTVYYYAHLDRYAEGIVEGYFAKQGEVIGYVGDTGNSGVGNYHLHFAIWSTSDPKRYWDGININPYPLLRGTK